MGGGAVGVGEDLPDYLMRERQSGSGGGWR